MNHAIGGGLSAAVEIACSFADSFFSRRDIKSQPTPTPFKISFGATPGKAI
jgi:hypothetical protein